MCIFAVASTMSRTTARCSSRLWIASKCVSLQWQAQCRHSKDYASTCCELLQNVYLCSGKHNNHPMHPGWKNVVNCFKMCIFAVASTIGRRMLSEETKLWIASKCVSLQWQAQSARLSCPLLMRCELLQNVYLCSGKHNDQQEQALRRVLWIASKCVSLQWQAQFFPNVPVSDYGCELLQNVYLCSGKHNPTWRLSNG